MEKHIVKRYSEPFKLQVVAEYEAGASESELRQKYGISGSGTIKNWIKKYAHAAYRTEIIRIQRAEEFQELKALRKKVSDLETALSESILENRMLKATIEAAEKAYGLDIKKNFVKTS